MKVTWFGTAAIAIESQDNRILFDPFVPLPGSDFRLDISSFEGYENILVTHGHFDHIFDIPKLVKSGSKKMVYCTETPCKTLIKRGVAQENIKVITNSERLEFGNIVIQAYQGKHAKLRPWKRNLIKHLAYGKGLTNIPFVSSTLIKYPENGETLLYEIQAEGKSIVLFGSMNLMDYVSYPTEMDLLILPYNGWADNFAVALKVIERLKPKKVLLNHFDTTFPPFTIPIDLKPIQEYYGDKIIVIDELQSVEI